MTTEQLYVSALLCLGLFSAGEIFPHFSRLDWHFNLWLLRLLSMPLMTSHLIKCIWCIKVGDSSFFLAHMIS